MADAQIRLTLDTQDLVTEILTRIQPMFEELKKQMALDADALRTAIDDATNDLADRWEAHDEELRTEIQDALDKVAAGNQSTGDAQAQIEAVLAKFQDVPEQLRAIGRDETDPVPGTDVPTTDTTDTTGTTTDTGTVNPNDGTTDTSTTPTTDDGAAVPSTDTGTTDTTETTDTPEVPATDTGTAPSAPVDSTVPVSSTEDPAPAQDNEVSPASDPLTDAPTQNEGAPGTVDLSDQGTDAQVADDGTVFPTAD